MAGKPKRYEVLLTQDAEQGLESIHDTIAGFDSVANANHVLDRLMEVVNGLAQFPERGSYPTPIHVVAVRLSTSRLERRVVSHGPLRIRRTQKQCLKVLRRHACKREPGIGLEAKPPVVAWVAQQHAPLRIQPPKRGNGLAHQG